MEQASAAVTHLQSGRRWLRAIVLACAIAFAIDLAIGIAQSALSKAGPDFLSFWAAGRLAAEGHPALAYDLRAHADVQRMVVTWDRLLPFPYPPPFLFFVSMVSFAPFWLAYAAWVCATSALYLFAARPWMPPAKSLAHPAAHVNVLIGQIGLLTTSIFLAGLSQLKRRPSWGGALLGLLLIKPQVFLLVPVALLAGREWRAIGGAAASVAFVSAAALLVFGVQAYAGFIRLLPLYGSLLEGGSWHWGKVASVYGLVRWVGLPSAAALAVQVLAAAVAAVLVWRAWQKDHPAKVPILAAGTLLVPPYLFMYDTLLLILPLAYFVQVNALRMALTVWLLCALSLLIYFSFYAGPNLTSLAAIVSLYLLTRGRVASEAAVVLSDG